MAESSKDKLFLEVVTPERIVVSTEVDEVVLPGIEGEFGVLPGHVPLLTALKVGELNYRTADRTEHVAVSWGYVEVASDRVMVLAETAEKATDINLARAQVAKEQAEQIITAGEHDPAYQKAKVRLEKAVTRVQVADRK
ncbi:ATP synthase epsilon chain [bacterium BMS3Abin14]|nr:ATP synthase epsilon chain [bacterium BMS3Abin14]